MIQSKLHCTDSANDHGSNGINEGHPKKAISKSKGGTNVNSPRVPEPSLKAFGSKGQGMEVLLLR